MGRIPGGIQYPGKQHRIPGGEGQNCILGKGQGKGTIAFHGYSLLVAWRQAWHCILIATGKPAMWVGV